MKAPSHSFYDLDTSPISVAHVTLLVQDLDRMTRFYSQLLGLSVFSSTETEAQLGADAPFLTLRAPGGLRRSPQYRPGLFHTAFLLPSRQDSGAWVQHARTSSQRVVGSDHVVSEALYLSDPEGNGIEVYADRPMDTWRDAQGRLRIVTEPLDMASLPTGEWRGAPEGTRIGHVHLQTTELAAAQTFWTAQGFEVMARYPGALFWGSGGYHHQLATNVWAGTGQPPRHDGLTGLSQVTLAAPVAQAETLTAPSGVAITFCPNEE